MSLKVGSAEAPPHSKAFGHVQIGEYIGGQPVLVPVILFHGTEDGPTLWVQACVHGDEYHNIAAILEMSRTLNPQKLYGSVVMIPAVNLTAVQARQRESPLDHSDLWLVFPGKADGFFSQQCANVWLNLITSTADYLVDLHTAGIYDEMADLVMYPKVGEENTDNASEQLAISFGFQHLVTLRHDPVVRSWLDPSLIVQCAIRGVPSLAVEFPGRGAAPLDSGKTECVCTGIRNVMRHLKMIEGSAETRMQNVFLDGLDIVTTTRGGIFHPEVKVSQRVMEGDVLATVTNFFGEEVEKIKSPVDAIVLDVMAYPIVGTGSWVFELGPLRKEH